MTNKAYIENIEIEAKHLAQPVLYTPEKTNTLVKNSSQIGFIIQVINSNVYIKFDENDSGTLCLTKNLKWI